MAGSTWKISTVRRVAVYHAPDARCTGMDADITYIVPLEWDDIFLGAQTSTVIDAPATHTTCSLFPVEEIAGAAGAVPSVSPTMVPDAGAGLDPSYYGEVYERIWCIPNYMRPQNPELDTDIPFTIWNAYPVPPDNVLNSITGSGQTGLTLDLSTPRSFFAIEELIVNLQITSTAPTQIYAVFEFNFDYGQGIFIFETIIADWIKIIPESPVVELWEWVSDILTAWDSTEQRISGRRQPRRRIEYYFLLEDDSEHRREYERYYNKLASGLVIPFYQYSTLITQNSVITDTKIYFDPDRTDVRDDELVVIYRVGTEESFLLRLDEVQSDGATLASPLTVNINAADIVAPAFTSRIDNATGPAMTSVSGRLDVRAWITEFRSSFDRPGSTASITEYDSLMVLDKRFRAEEDIPNVFDVHPTIIDSESGLHDQRSSWLHAFISGMRSFIVPRQRLPIEMDWWRDFITALVGQREPFLMPTWRRDLTLAVIPNPGDYQIEINEDTYSAQQFPYDTYKRLQFLNSSGDIIYRTVTGVTDQPGGTTLLDLDDPLPLNFAWAEDFDISFLNKVRLATDQVRLEHYVRDTVITIAVRTTDQ